MGSVIVTISFLLVGFTKEITDFWTTDEETSRKLAIFVAVMAIYVADFAINAGTPRFPASRSIVQKNGY